MTVYAYNCAAVRDGDYLRMLDRVSAERRAQAARFVRREDGVRSVCGELMARTLFAARHPGRECAIVKGEHGKPAVADSPDFHFNVSHSGDWVVCALADRPVGVDVERIGRDGLDIANRFFSEPEVELLRRAQDVSRCFAMLWTAKESYIKCVGAGLSMPLNGFSAAGGVIVRGGERTDYLVTDFELDPRYALAACAQGVRGGRLVIMNRL